MTEPTRLAPLDWVLATTLLGYALALSLAQGLRLERTIAWGALRAFAQLALVGLALGWVLAARSPWVVVGVLLLMALLAADGARRRVQLAVPRSRRIIFAAIAAAACAVLPLIVLVVLRLDPWWEPAHLVPIGGLLIGSVMTGSSLALDRLVGEVRARRAEVEAAVALGATASQAARPAVAAAIHAAMIAPINHLMIVGVIQIPGVTTGLILAGQDPARRRLPARHLLRHRLVRDDRRDGDRAPRRARAVHDARPAARGAARRCVARTSAESPRVPAGMM